VLGQRKSLAEPQRPGRILSWILRRGAPSYAVGVLTVSLLKYGIGLYPSWNYMQALAENWRNPLLSPLLKPPASYRLASSTSAVVAGLLGFLSGRAFLAFHFFLACGAIAAPFCLKVVRRSAELRLLVALLLIGGAIPPVLLGWVGSYDPVTIGAGAIAALAASPLALFGWTVLAFNHAPEAGIALVVYWVVLIAHERGEALRRIVMALCGWAVGYLAIRGLQAGWGAGASRLGLVDFYGAS
jgi:hypothetical protein